ncbi:MAG: hypothetical protein KKC75_03535 [Nanoarchaeota archaeon]|nr:hypothetical protein [Nanoarchaeota archaeon]
MNITQKREAEKRAKFFMFLTVAKIVSEFMIILGFFIFIYYLVRRVG